MPPTGCGASIFPCGSLVLFTGSIGMFNCIAIVGATGAVGQEFISLIEERGLNAKAYKLLSSARSAGKTIQLNGDALTVEELTPESFGGVDLALFSAGGTVSKAFAPIAVKSGCVVVDNSSAFRMANLTK